MGPAWVLQLLAQLQPAPDRGGLLRSAMGLWLTLLCAGALLVLGVWALLGSRRKRRRAQERENTPDRRPIKDAWTESARRLEVQPLDSPDDDDLKVDR
jgi:hypothetical protein